MPAHLAVVEKHRLDGANTFTLMNHKHKGHKFWGDNIAQIYNYVTMFTQP